MRQGWADREKPIASLAPPAALGIAVGLSLPAASGRYKPQVSPIHAEAKPMCARGASARRRTTPAAGWSRSRTSTPAGRLAPQRGRSQTCGD